MARNPNSPLRTLSATHIQAQKPTGLVGPNLGAASTASLSASVTIIDPDADRKTKLETALGTVARWGWSNTVGKIDEIKTVTPRETEYALLKFLRIVGPDIAGLAPWFEIPKLPFFLPFIDAWLAMLAYRYDFDTPIKKRRILFWPDWIGDVEIDEKTVAAMIIHEAIHHELYPIGTTCIHCTDDHRGIGTAWIANAANVGVVLDKDPIPDESNNWPSNEGGFQPSGVYPAIENDIDDIVDISSVFAVGFVPPQARLDAIEQILADWGIGNWVVWALPGVGVWRYYQGNPPSYMLEGILYSGDSNWNLVVNIALGCLSETVKRWNSTGKIENSRHASYEAKWRAFAALMSRIGKLEETYPLIDYYKSSFIGGLAPWV